MTTRPPSACDSCIHRISETACEAFDEIPERFLLLGEAHTEREPEQSNGVVWDFAPGAEQEFDFWDRLRQVELR
jgi:hypothetical protein